MGRRLPFALLALFLLLTILVAKQSQQYPLQWPLSSSSQVTGKATTSTKQVTLVSASHSAANTTWLLQGLPRWNHQIYITDVAASSSTIPTNKGHEVMVYLTYIVDNYDALSPITIFYHADRFQWHNDVPAGFGLPEDGLELLSHLNLSHVEKEGFVNLRCVWEPGCPFFTQPFEDEASAAAVTDTGESLNVQPRVFYKQAFESLFPDVPLPSEVGASCCAQFAVTASTVLRRSKAEYEHYRRWLLDTELTDVASGTVMEYIWHSKQAVVPST